MFIINQIHIKNRAKENRRNSDYNTNTSQNCFIKKLKDRQRINLVGKKIKSRNNLRNQVKENSIAVDMWLTNL